MKLILILGAVLLALPSRADWQANAISAGIIGTGMADYATTKIALSHGGVEVNPMMRLDEPWLGILKIGATGAMAGAIHYSMTRAPDAKVRRGAKWIGLGVSVFQGWVVSRNVGVIVRLRR